MRPMPAKSEEYIADAVGSGGMAAATCQLTGVEQRCHTNMDTDVPVDNMATQRGRIINSSDLGTRSSEH